MEKETKMNHSSVFLVFICFALFGHFNDSTKRAMSDVTLTWALDSKFNSAIVLKN